MLESLLFGGIDFVIVLFLALVFDRLTREPPDWLHPVAWVGRFIGFISGVGPSGADRKPAIELSPPDESVAWKIEQAVIPRLLPFLRGVLTVLSAIALALAGALFILWLADGLPRPLDLILLAYALKLAISPGALATNAKRVALMAADPQRIESARAGLSSLVSRETADLDASGIASATVSSVSENFNDALVAPIFYALLFGLPGAWVFRAMNTADSMVGYRGVTEWSGKASARLDDMLGFVPARISGLLLCLAAPLAWLSGGRALKVMLSDARLTPSPNSGWPMAAAAGALGVRLDKPGIYSIGPEFSPPTPASIRPALRLMWVGVLLCAFLAAIVGLGVSAAPAAGVAPQLTEALRMLIQGG